MSDLDRQSIASAQAKEANYRQTIECQDAATDDTQNSQTTQSAFEWTDADMRMACVRAALDMNAQSQQSIDAGTLVANAEHIFSYVIGKAA